MLPRHAHVPGACRAAADVLALVGDKWSLRAVMALGDGPRRFNALRREIPGVSQQVLSRTLRALERDGMLTRTAYATVPPRVDYALTELGRSLWAAAGTLGEWAREQHPAIDAARRRYDASRDAEPPSRAAV